MRIGIVGLHGHVTYVMEGVRARGGCEIVAVSGHQQDAVDRFIRREPLARYAQSYLDWRHLVEHSLMDVCIVAGENGERAEQLIDLAARGVHIVAEKPLTTTLEDLARVRKALDKSDSRLTMLLTMRHDPKYWTMKQLVESGAIGTVRQVSCQKSYRLGDRPDWQKSRARLGGTIPYIGVHALDLMQWVSGLPFTRLAAFHSAGAVPQMEETEDSASILVAYEGGATGTARLDYLRPAAAPSHGDDRFRIAGTKGVLEIRYPDPQPQLIKPAQPPQRIPLERVDHLFVDFVRSLEQDTGPQITEDDCFHITEVVLKARQAADDGVIVDLPTPNSQR